MKPRTKLFIAAAMLLAIGAIILFPDLANRWLQYNLKMVVRMTGRILPFFWINICLAAAVYVLEAFVVGWKNSSLYRFLTPSKSIISDVCIFLISSLHLDYIIVFIVTLGVLRKFEHRFDAAFGITDGFLSVMGSPALQLFVYILIADLAMYTTHYLHHKISFLWAFHSYHHSATEMNVVTGVRSHPIQEEFANSLIILIPMTLMGVPFTSLLVYRIIRNCVTFMHHSKLPWKWGLFGRYVVVSPRYHLIHHSTLPEHYNKNISVLLPIWDHLFGTYYKGTTPVKSMGLPENPYNKRSFLDDMLVPFRMFKRAERIKGSTDQGINGSMDQPPWPKARAVEEGSTVRWTLEVESSDTLGVDQ